MLTIILTAYKEHKTIQKAISSIVDPTYSGIGGHKIDQIWELLVVAPDQDTINAANQEFKKFNLDVSKARLIIDNQKGKPAALNQGFVEAKGDYILLTDGDVYLGKNAVNSIIEKLESDLILGKNCGGISGRPISENTRNSILGYWGGLLADAADHKRKIDLTNISNGISKKFIPKRKFFPLSGYLMLVKNINWQIPEDTLVDDAYISYILYNKGYSLNYSEKSEVFVKYPTNLKDYFIQKKRSAGGYVQLWNYGVVTNDTKARSLWRELEYIWFPFKYAKSFKELIWSLLLYPVRLWLWIVIYWERKIINKNFTDTWARVESTK